VAVSVFFFKANLSSTDLVRKASSWQASSRLNWTTAYLQSVQAGYHESPPTSIDHPCTVQTLVLVD